MRLIAHLCANKTMPEPNLEARTNGSPKDMAEAIVSGRNEIKEKYRPAIDGLNEQIFQLREQKKALEDRIETIEQERIDLKEKKAEDRRSTRTRYVVASRGGKLDKDELEGALDQVEETYNPLIEETDKRIAELEGELKKLLKSKAEVKEDITRLTDLINTKSEKMIMSYQEPIKNQENKE